MLAVKTGWDEKVLNVCLEAVSCQGVSPVKFLLDVKVMRDWNLLLSPLNCGGYLIGSWCRNPAVMLIDVKGRVLCVSDRTCYGGGTDWRTKSNEFEGHAYLRSGIFLKRHLFHKFSCSSGITASLGNTSIFSLARCLSGKPDTRWVSSPPLVWSVHFLAFSVRLLSPFVLVWSVVNAVMVLGTYLWKAICLFPEKQAREDTYSPRVVQQGRKEKGVGWESRWTLALDSEDLGPSPTI